MAIALPRRRRWRVALTALIAAGVLVAATGGPYGIYRLYRLHAQVRRLHAEITDADAAIDSLSREIERLKNDTVYIEKIARERLGMATRNERVFRFIDKK